MITYLSNIYLPLDRISLSTIVELITTIQQDKNKITIVINGDNQKLNIKYRGNTPLSTYYEELS